VDLEKIPPRRLEIRRFFGKPGRYVGSVLGN